MMAGLVVVLLVLLVVFNVLYLLYWGLDALGNPYVTMGAEALLLSFTICPRSLASAAEEIYTFLIHHHLGAAREKVGWIVGRDTDQLDEGEIVRATVETVAENTTDGIISPLFFYAIGGLPLAVLYRAVNTMDSMLGYKNEKYLYFGRPAARLDDICNFIPARITGLLFIIAAFFLRLDYGNAWRMMRRDAAKHPSPNGGYAEASVAGALDIRLGGYNSYFGKMTFRAYMGMRGRLCGPSYPWSCTPHVCRDSHGHCSYGPVLGREELMVIRVRVPGSCGNWYRVSVTGRLFS